MTADNILRHGAYICVRWRADRRAARTLAMPAPGEEYDFVTYFECADADVGTFHAVRTALRNTSRNPEWAFVREGPLWHGRRVESWADLFD